MSLIGYARVSTLDQHPELQHDALKAAGCERIYTDKASGKLDERPALATVIDHLQPGDTLVVWKLDRLGRSLKHLVGQVADFEARGVGFRSLKENIDTTSATGRLIFHIFAALAEFESDMLSERTQAGLSAARARGRLGGRKPKVNGGADAQIRAMYDSGKTAQEIADTFRVSRSTVQRHLEKTPSAVRSIQANPASSLDDRGRSKEHGLFPK